MHCNILCMCWLSFPSPYVWQQYNPCYHHGNTVTQKLTIEMTLKRPWPLVCLAPLLPLAPLMPQWVNAVYTYAHYTAGSRILNAPPAPLPTLPLLRLLLAIASAPPVGCPQPACTIQFIPWWHLGRASGRSLGICSTPKLFPEMSLTPMTPFLCKDKALFFVRPDLSFNSTLQIALSCRVLRSVRPNYVVSPALHLNH